MTVFLKNLDLSKLKGHKAKQEKVIKPPPLSFPTKLYQMLDAVERQGNEHIVAWNPGGRSFQVHNAPKFVECVLPFHFKQTKYKSFQRQLNFYGFRRITSGPLEGSYKHSMFIRGNEALCNEIKRLAGKDSNKSGAAVSSHEPGSDYESSSELSETAPSKFAAAASSEVGSKPCPKSCLEAPENTTKEIEALADMSIFDTKQDSTAQSQEAHPHRRDSYQTAREMLVEGPAVPFGTPSRRRDSFFQAIDKISTIEHQPRGRRDSFAETRMSFVGKKFHFLPAEFADLYSDDE